VLETQPAKPALTAELTWGKLYKRARRDFYGY
jgi:hypothetical protein